MVKKEKQNSSDETSPLRIPKVKKRFGLKVPDIRMPHLELVQPEGQEIFTDTTDINKTLVENFQKPSQTTQTTQTTQTRQPPIQNISPTKDFQKVPNSLTRNAIPEGVFKAGKSKQLYDVLYSLTRGSINASHSIRISKTKLMKKAGIGSRITFDTIISHFESIGLITIKVYPGQHQGNEFKVFTYEESLTRQTTQPSQTRYAQKLDRLLTLETRQTSHSLNEEKPDTYENPKTSLKTINPDDEQTATFADFNKKISEASERITGKKINPRETKKWGEVAELLILELELAAARTEAVSSVPAFLKEVLRRKLETGATSKNRESGKLSKQMQVGKSPVFSEPEKWERESLSADEKQKTLQVMKQRKAEGHFELVKSMEQIYTTADWKWLMSELERELPTG